MPAAILEQVAFQRVDQHLDLGPVGPQGRQLGHVIEVMVGEQHMAWVHPEPLRGVDQRSYRPASVDEERLAALIVCDQIVVGQEPLVHRALDDHRAILAETAPGTLGNRSKQAGYRPTG